MINKRKEEKKERKGKILKKNYENIIESCNNYVKSNKIL